VSVGFKTHSLALIADAFHVLFDLLSFAVALAAILISEKGTTTSSLSFGWQRAQLLGSFFNGVFQLALGFSIFLLSLERFVSLERVDNPKLVLIVACAGLASNIISGTFLGVHDHGHEHGAGSLDFELLVPHNELGHRHNVKPQKKQRWKKVFSHDHGHAHGDHHDHEHGHTNHGNHHDLGTKAVLIHVLGDAFNNLGVIVAAAVIWKAHYPARFYADPATSMGIGIMLILTAFKLVWSGGLILLQTTPLGVDVEDVKHDLENVPGVLSVHELHVWRLNETKACASAHIVVADASLEHFKQIASTMNECLHAYGIHSATIQPEVATSSAQLMGGQTDNLVLRKIRESSGCEMNCGASCEEKSCCG